MVFVLPRPPGPNIITGSESDDVLIGTDSHDAIFANGGSDRVFAGGGNDSIVLDLDGRFDFIDGGSGVDTLSYWQVDKGMRE